MIDDQASSNLNSSHRILRNELLVVLAVSFLSSAGFSTLQFVYDAFNTPPSTPVAVTRAPPEFDYYAFASMLLGRLVRLAPVALVAHLFARENRSLADLGFDRSRPSRDAMVGTGLALLGVGVAYAAYVSARSFGFLYRPIVPFTPGAHPAFWIFIFVPAAVAALSEELIINAYLLRRLDQLGWGQLRALTASAFIRGVIHLYQGMGGFVNNFVGGLIVGRIFQRTNRIAPIVVAHFMFDVIVSLIYLWLRDVLPGIS